MAMKRATLGSRWASATDVTDRLRRARENREAHQSLIASLDARTQRRRAEMEQTLSDLPPSQRTSLAARAAASLRGELRQSTSAVRADHIRTATNLAAEASEIRNHYSSPVQLLMRESLGSERRSRILQQIDHSGPAELASLAEFAAATKDKELAAALCSRVGALKSADRPFSAQELAGVMYGGECRRIEAALMEIDRLSVEVTDTDRTFVNGRKNGNDTVRVALMKQAERELAVDDEEADETADAL